MYILLIPFLINTAFIKISWYGFFYFLSFAIGFLWLNHLAKKKEIDLTVQEVQDLITFLLVGIILGARIFYILFYNLNYYLGNPAQIIALWNGGLSFHGGLVGALLAGWLFCKWKKKNFFAISDQVTIPVAFGLMLGRIANFINGELVGRVTTLPWCVEFSGYQGCRHPSQLYESAKNAIILGTLLYFRKRKLPTGTLTFTFLFMYSILRFLIGFVRAPDSQIGFVLFGLTMGQLLNIAMFIISGAALYHLKHKDLNTKKRRK